jgi:hypothetical protein
MPSFRQVFDSRLTADRLRVEVHQVKKTAAAYRTARGARNSHTLCRICDMAFSRLIGENEGIVRDLLQEPSLATG